MTSGQPDGPAEVSQARVARDLRRAGCSEEVLRLLVGTAGPGRDPAVRLAEIARFVRALGPAASHDYFRALQETGAVAELTRDPVLAFARSVDPHTAEWYFWAVWGTRAVRELTSAEFLGSADVLRRLDSQATVEYFLAIRETGAAAALTQPDVLAFARALGSDACVEFFGACWETRAVPELTHPAVLDFARSLGADGAAEYFRAVRETKSVATLTEPGFREFVRSLGERLACDYLRAVRTTRAVAVLTGEDVRLFSELIGKASSRAYFRTIASTGSIGPLTSPALFRTSGVIRAIGAEPALDFFLAVARTREVPQVPDDGRDPGTGVVPVVTLLDLPSYDRLRPAGLAAATAAFWASAWQVGRFAIGPVGGPAGVGLAFAAWAGLLVGLYLLLGAIVAHVSDQFLQRRRRLLNEHGIRWHDCLAGDQRCPLCWTSAKTHEDRRFDYGRFCRCPAC